MKTPEVKKIWDICIKNKKVPDQNQSPLLDFLKTITAYKVAASRPDARLSVQYRTFGKFKAWVLILNGYLPVTKKKVFGGKDSDRKKFIFALRNDVSHQILHFRSKIKFPQICHISGQELKSWSETHVDHVYPFSKLAEDWLKENGMSMSDVKLKGSPNKKTISDELLRKSWQEYHFAHADLKCAEKIQNIKKGNKILPACNKE